MLLTPYLFIHSRLTFSTGWRGKQDVEGGGGDQWHASYQLLSPVMAGSVVLLFFMGVSMIEADSHEPCACHRVHLSGLLRCGDTPVDLPRTPTPIAPSGREHAETTAFHPCRSM